MPSIDISFSNNYGIYVFVYLLLPFLFFYKAKIINNTKDNTISFTYETSTQLKGIFIIIIILHHIAQRMDQYGLLALFHVVGYLSVGIFFFISGVGLTKSLKRNNKYLDGFLYKKIARICLPFLIINALTVLGLYLNGSIFMYEKFIKYTLSLALIDSTLWFIVTIMIFYFFFYISFKKSYTVKSLMLVTGLVLTYIIVYILLNKGDWTYISSLCFLFGIYYVFFEEKIHLIIYNKYFTLMFISILLFIIAFVLHKSYKLVFISAFISPTQIMIFISSFITPVFFTIMILIIFVKIQPQTFLFNFIGNISLEIYLLHMKILLFFSFLTEFDSGIWIMTYFFSLIITAFIFSKFNALIYSKLVLFYTRIRN